MAKKEPGTKVKSRKYKPQTLTGMHDYLPGDMKYWDRIERVLRSVSESYNYGKLITPILEETKLFVRSIGDATDIVQKETYSFKDKGGDEVTLRPEFTASFVRAYIEHGMVNLPQPVKMWNWGPCFRHEKPQAGRYRQFYQVSFEALGGEKPVVDAELIMIAYSILKELGIDAVAHVNSIGSPESRKMYYEVLGGYLKDKKKNLCKDCQKRVLKNPLRIFDCKEQSCQDLLVDAPQLVDHIDEESNQHFVKVLEYLDEAEIPYVLDPKLVRGLDYYTRTVFEFVSPEDEEKRMGTLIAGGRYDGLTELLGGRETPACGFAAGIERLIMKMKEAKVDIKEEKKEVDIFLAQLGESATKRALKLFEDLRQAGFKVSAEFMKQGLKSQLSLAAKMNAKVTLILGQKEIVDKTVIIRDMENSAQEIINFDKVFDEVNKRLKKSQEGVKIKKLKQEKEAAQENLLEDIEGVE